MRLFLLFLALKYTRPVHHEQALIARFVKRARRDRYREFVATPRLRPKFIRELPHFRDFDRKFRLPIPSDKLSIQSILRELQRRHSPAVVFAISEDPALDQQDLPLADALDRIVGRGMGTILSCVPGRLVFVQTEDERFILERHDPLEKREYVRFVVDYKDEDSHVGQGVFQAMSRALERGTITGSDADELEEIRWWFNQNLEKPTSFGRGRHSLGICWFKTAATEHIARIFEMVRVLERNGIAVKKIKTDKPGYVVYEDELQLVAEPFRKGTLPKR